MVFIKLLAIIVLAYLIGSIPVGVIMARRLAGIDPRNYGSGKTGGTNVMRVLGTKVGVLVIVLDIFKASLAVLLAAVIFGSTVVGYGNFYLHRQMAELAAALAVMVGHNWPIFLKFRGGRGVAAFFGSLIPIAPAAAVFGAEVLFIVAVSTKYMSAGSIAGAFAAWVLLIPMVLYGAFPPIFLGVILLAATLVVYQHRDNIDRLRRGIERKLGEKADKTRRFSPSRG